MSFSLDSRVAPPDRPRFIWPLRAVAVILRRFAVLVAIIAMWQRRLLRMTAPWKLAGTCASCGKCCENLLLEVDEEGTLARVLRQYWHEIVFDFYPKENVLERAGGRYRAYGCRNFTSDRKCARYGLRPFVCRAYPALALLDRPQPKAHCGFRVIDD